MMLRLIPSIALMALVLFGEVSSGRFSRNPKKSIVTVLTWGGGWLAGNWIAQEMADAGYREQMGEITQFVFWIGPVVFLGWIGSRQRAFTKALLNAKRSPVPGWEQFDPTERNENQVHSYAKESRITYLIAFAVAACWFAGGIILYVA